MGIKLLKKLKIRLTPQSILDKERMLNEYIVFDNWIKGGSKGLPPHIFKQNVIFEFQQKSGYEILIETGTYRGDMVEAQKNHFKRIYSIELSEMLFKRAKKRFLKDKNVLIVQGDSGKILSSIVDELNKPAIFWLDGHYSAGMTAKGDKECPIFEELYAILNNNNLNHILLIDDARCFIGKGDYPTIEQLTAYINTKKPKYKIEIKNDIICYTI